MKSVPAATLSGQDRAIETRGQARYQRCVETASEAAGRCPVRSVAVESACIHVGFREVQRVSLPSVSRGKRLQVGYRGRLGCIAVQHVGLHTRRAVGVVAIAGLVWHGLVAVGRVMPPVRRVGPVEWPRRRLGRQSHQSWGR